VEVSVRIFITGATGWIGSAVVPELLNAGHHVLGLARSDAAAASLAALGAEVQRGDLDDPDSLRSGAAASDGVVHLGYNHDFARIEAAAQTDLVAINAIGSALEGSDRPFVIASGTPGSLLVVSRPSGTCLTRACTPESPAPGRPCRSPHGGCARRSCVSPEPYTAPVIPVS
jgi:putative NADH-flavin reductase